jgi:hypothetical protein
MRDAEMQGTTSAKTWTRLLVTALSPSTPLKTGDALPSLSVVI